MTEKTAINRRMNSLITEKNFAQFKSYITALNLSEKVNLINYQLGLNLAFQWNNLETFLQTTIVPLTNTATNVHHGVELYEAESRPNDVATLTVGPSHIVNAQFQWTMLTHK